MGKEGVKREWRVWAGARSYLQQGRSWWARRVFTVITTAVGPSLKWSKPFGDSKLPISNSPL